MHGIGWDDLRLFLTCARSGSFTAAAEAAALDQSTVSRRIQKLERDLATSLFTRSRAGVQLTAAGRRLLPLAERIDGDIARLGRPGALLDDRVEGTVRVACTAAVASELAARWLPDTLREHPGLVLELLADVAQADLQHGHADLAVRLVRPRDQGLRGRRVGYLDFGVYVAVGHKRRRADRFVTRCGPIAKSPEGRWAAAREDIVVAARVSTLPGLVEAVAAGVGRGVLPRALARADPRLEEVAPVPEIAPRPVWLVWPQEARQRRSVSVVIDALSAYYEARLAPD